MRFIIAASFFAALGFAHAGDGLVTKLCRGYAIRGRAEYRDAIWIWDENRSVEENELLRREGFPVLGGGRYADTIYEALDAMGYL